MDTFEHLRDFTNVFHHVVRLNNMAMIVKGGNQVLNLSHQNIFFAESAPLKIIQMSFNSEGASIKYRIAIFGKECNTSVGTIPFTKPHKYRRVNVNMMSFKGSDNLKYSAHILI